MSIGAIYGDVFFKTPEILNMEHGIEPCSESQGYIVCFQGCNFRCSYCFAGDLVLKKQEPISINKALLRLHPLNNETTIVVSGGECTMSPDIIPFLEEIKGRNNFKVRVDTNGHYPDIIQEIIEKKLTSYIAMDIKAPESKYKKVTRGKVNISNINRSIELIKSFHSHKFRTTVANELLSEEDILEIVDWIKGAKAYEIRDYRSSPYQLTKNVSLSPFGKERLELLQKKIEGSFDETLIFRDSGRWMRWTATDEAQNRVKLNINQFYTKYKPLFGEVINCAY